MKRNSHNSSARRKKTPSAAVSQGDAGFHVAKLFMNGRSQALRLPKELRYRGDSVYLRRVPGGVMIVTEEDRKNALIRAFGSIPDFMEDRNQPPNQERPDLDHLSR